MPRRREKQSISKDPNKIRPANLPVSQTPSRISPNGTTSMAPGSSLNFRIGRAVGMILSDYKLPQLNLDLIGQRLGLTKPYLCRVFKREVGLGIPGYICRVRANAAEKLLRETVFSIKEIAAAVGFTYITQLDRAFKSNYGCAPKEYRTRISAVCARPCASYQEKTAHTAV